MIKVKLYLYDRTKGENGYRGEDLSDYVLSGAQNTENLTEELDESEITLSGYNKKEEFAPETKFIVDVYENGTLVTTYHRVVQEDVVEQPILSDNNYFVHTITLIEPSVIAQKRIVDDISVSYKLKDVTLEKIPAFNLNREMETITSNTPPFANLPKFENIIVSEEGFWQSYRIRRICFGKYFKWGTAQNADDNSVKVKYTNTADQKVTSNLYYTNIASIKEVNNKREVRLELPIPAIYWGTKDQTDQYTKIGYASFICEVKETNAKGEEAVVLSQRFISKSSLNGNQSAPTDYPYSQFVQSYIYSDFRDEYLPEHSYLDKTTLSTPSGNSVTVYCNYYFAKYTDKTNGTDFSNIANKPITNAFEVKKDCTYDITLRVLNLVDPNEDFDSLISKKDDAELYGVSIFQPYTDSTLRSYSYNGYGYERRFIVVSSITKVYAENPSLYNGGYLPTNNFDVSSKMFCFSSADSQTIMIQSAIPYTALSLIKKAIANSSLYQKVPGVGADDLSASSPYPFYVEASSEPNTISESDLNGTRINESFFHQKNLWEILLEAGKYCHAIPQIGFGDNDRFKISFYKLGTTDTRENKATKISIMNFRKVDDYVSACSSYVDNLVQLGGQITEIIAPKTSSEDYTISNNTAEIIVSKPIIEILKVTAISTELIDWSYKDEDGNSIPVYYPAGTRIDITPFIYEKSVYNLLSVHYDEKPNKGIALYYELGDNSILGGDYQLPQAVTNPYTDFAFKKVLFSALAGYPANLDRSGTNPEEHSPWYDIKVNTFLFEVTYRTKDTARIESTRPDLRHYLLSSSKDEVPHHRQFNNQQDILVDSEAFGNNMFGKLIRTGNSNYKINEWCNSFDEIKHKGELYIINEQWYYVAKVTNIFFADHIESIVEYSKDYNQLSQIIGIPSEPRFYEISERSRIDREVQFNDYLVISTEQTKVKTDHPDFSRFYHIVSGIIFGDIKKPYMKWAWTTFKGDANILDENTFGDAEFSKTVINPVNAYLCKNTLTFEWDMEDNFSAGTSTTNSENTDLNTADSAYAVMQAVQYCDKFGKAALIDVKLSHSFPFFYPYINSDTFVYNTQEAKEVRVLPNAEITEIISGQEVTTPITPLNNISDITFNNMILLKDSREAIHLNYNLMVITDSDRFILSPFLLEEKEKKNDITGLWAIYLTEEVSKFTDGYILKSKILQQWTAGWGYIYGETSFPITINVPNGVDMKRVKSIALFIDDPKYNPSYSDRIKFLIARNVTGENIQNGDTLMWYFGAPNKDAIWNAENGNRQ